MKISRDWKIILGVWGLVAAACVYALISNETKDGRAEAPHALTAKSKLVVRRLSPWHVEQVEQYFKNSSMKPSSWGVSILEVRDVDMTVVLLALDKYSKEELNLTLQHMCPPDDAQLWHGLNQANVIYLAVQHPLDPYTTLASGQCRGPEQKPAVVSSTFVK